MQREEKSVQRRERIGETKRSVMPGRLALLAALALAAAVCPGMAQSGQQPPPVRLTLKQAVGERGAKEPGSLAGAPAISVLPRRIERRARTVSAQLLCGLGRGLHQRLPDSGRGGRAGSLQPYRITRTYSTCRRAGDVHADEQKAEQQRLQVDAVRDGVIERAASAYLQLAKVRQQLDVVRSERESAQKILDYTRQRMEAGFELPIEVTRAQLTAAQVEERMAQLEDQEDTTADQLRFLLGLAAGPAPGSDGGRYSRGRGSNDQRPGDNGAALITRR